MNNEPNPLREIAQRITDRVNEMVRRETLGGFEEADIAGRLDELELVMRHVVELAAAENDRISADTDAVLRRAG